MSIKETDCHAYSDIWGGVHPEIMMVEDSHQPVRQVVRRTRGRVLGRYPSLKNGRMVSWESQLEQKACSVFEFSRSIKSYFEQPATFALKRNNDVISYTPDFLLKSIDSGDIYVEVKPLKYLVEQNVTEKLQLFGDHLTQRGASLIALTEVELDNIILQSNLALLRQYSRAQVDNCLIRRAIEIVSNSPVSIESLSAELKSSACVIALLARNYLTFDYLEPLLPSSIVHLPKEKDDAHTLFSKKRTY